MKLDSVLDRLGSIEKNSFIKVIDNIISHDPKNSKQVEKILSSADKGLKSADSENVKKVFELIQDEFYKCLKCEFQETSSQLDILIDIITRDGNCIMKLDWFSRLYESEVKKIKSRVKEMERSISDPKSELSIERKRDYHIYKSCLETAYINDIENNREAKITSDELSIVLTLSNVLDLSQEEVKLINYSILPIKKLEILDVVNNLKNIGVIFFSKKENTIYVADEMVRLLRRLRGKDVADKYLRRTLRIMREPVINQICRTHNISIKESFNNKIELIIKEGISFKSLLAEDIHKKNTTLTEKKKYLNEVVEKGLEIENLRGSILEDKIDSLIEHFDHIERDEKIPIALDGYEKLLAELNNSLPKLNKQIRDQFELQEEFVLKGDFLLDFNIKPRDILDLIEKDDLKYFIAENGIKQRGNNILNILEHYKDADNLFLENYERVAYRDLNGLKENGITTKESELGLKFEELTGRIFQELGFTVDDGLKNGLKSNKDIMDIILHLDNGDVIIVECKTSKEKGYNKFSTVSRQLKAYKNQVEKKEKRIAKILLVSPEFTDDFITDCEMNVELNLSLITASSLLKIYKSFKESAYHEFPHVLFRDVLINEDRIVKALSK
ncbi:restriction endonuclease [Christiangramia echinicola]|uniref:restriction endonuclease n=1 Tax=Christiangramia echinicola TaxID=279359 RepID=UPI0004182C97|nr:restriction endonuclease [Christiangramia echinicola]